MKLESYKDYFHKAKIGDIVHYIDGNYHFKWKLKYKLPDGFIGVGFIGKQVFKKDVCRHNCTETSYIQPKKSLLKRLRILK